MNDGTHSAPETPPGGLWQGFIAISDTDEATTIEQARQALAALFPGEGEHLSIDPASPGQHYGIWHISLPEWAIQRLADSPQLLVERPPYAIEISHIEPYAARRTDPRWLVNLAMHELSRRYPGIVFSSTQLRPARRAAAQLLLALGVQPIEEESEGTT